MACSIACAAEPPAINPFGPTPAERDSQREDAVPGCIELSDGSIHPGLIYLTRDKRLKIYDEQLERQREIPLRVVKQIDCAVKKEWMEREWKYKETTSDEKMYTGRSYPAREYLHTITLHDGRTITGPLAEIVYLQQPQDDSQAAAKGNAEPKVERFLLNKRNKGEAGAGIEIADLRQTDQAGQGRFGRREEERQEANRAVRSRKRLIPDL